jgi:hypothetical protein
MPAIIRNPALVSQLEQLQMQMSAADYALFDQALNNSPALTTELNSQAGISVTAITYRTGTQGGKFVVTPSNNPLTYSRGEIVIGDQFLTQLKAGLLSPIERRLSEAGRER